MRRSQPLDDVGLNGIGVLVLIHHNILVLLIELAADLLVFRQELPEEYDQIIIVHEMIRLLMVCIGLQESFHVRHAFQELGILLTHEKIDRLLKVG